ncbi:MAG: hypothetical protein KME05_20480 [Gloeocapsa sp. UFS-A4-WI-NPMV-4B04]|nr:hypothetical protein [Gloeocapsa sp. UFS-A4-WI-NPMV-4B04]
MLTSSQSKQAIADDGSCLQVKLETDNGYSLESLSAPLQAFRRLIP